MADNRPSGSNNTLYFIVGALIIIVLVIGWFMYGREKPMAPAPEPAATEAPAPAPEPAPAMAPGPRT